MSIPKTKIVWEKTKATSLNSMAGKLITSIVFAMSVFAMASQSFAQRQVIDMENNHIVGKGEIGHGSGPRPINPIAAEGSRTRPTQEGPIIELPRDVTTLKICSDADFKGVICTSTSGVAMPGDSNLDGLFDSADLTLAMTSGEFEDAIPRNSTWNDGDWNRDGEFDSSDIRIAFESNRFVQTSPRSRMSAVPEPGTTVMALLGVLVLFPLRRRWRS